MELLLKRVVISFITIFYSACAGGMGINFQDGSWSTCTYSKKDGTTFTGPLQLGGAPLAFTQPNGTKVECVPIPEKPEKV